MKEFKEWCKDKVIAFTEGYRGFDFNETEINHGSEIGINGVTFISPPYSLTAYLCGWMYKKDYDKLEYPKDCIGLWNEVPQQFEKYCNMFNEKTRIR